MKKSNLSIALGLLLTAILLGSFSVSAQQSAAPESSNGDSSLERSLNELQTALKESVAIDVRPGYVRRTHVRLKKTDGCNVSFLVTFVPSSSLANQPYKPVADLSTGEWKINLSDLDVAAVRIGAPAKGDYRVIHFATTGAKDSIKWKGHGVNQGGWVSEGRIDVATEQVSRAAAALQQAIGACKQ